MSSRVIHVVIFGGRDFCMKNKDEYHEEWILAAFKRITKLMSNYLKDDNVSIVVVDGEATGADTVGFRWGESNGFEPKRFPAKWKDEEGNYNPAAGFIRNGDMAAIGDVFIGFWDGKSTGTNHMRKLVVKSKKPLRMYQYNPQEHSELKRIRAWEE